MPNENDVTNTNSDVETNTNSDNEQSSTNATDATSNDNSSDNTDTNEPAVETNHELEDFKKYAKIDYDDDDSLIQIFLVASKNYITKATGQIYDDAKELHHLLKNLLALHFYENRQSVNASSINEVPFTIQNLLTFIQSTSDSTYELQEKEVVPTDAIQEVVADPEYFGLSKVTVQGVKLQNLTISQNGEYEAGEEYSGLGKIIVNVLPNLEDKFITENGIYYPPEGKDGYRNISVNVQASPTLIDKTFTENGTYLPETNTDGYRKVTIEVEQPAEPVLENLTVKSTNTEQIILPSTGVDGFDKVTVQKINLQEKSINPSTSQQTIQADSAYDGLNQVNISAIQTEQKTVKSSQNPQVIYPTSGKFINQITVEANTLQSKAVTPTTSAQTVQADSSYYGLDHVNVSAIQTENKTVKSTDTSQVIYPTSGKFINQITVEPMDLENKIVKSTETQQTINPTSGKDGISSIIVEPIISEDITTKSTTTQQVINPSTGKDYIKSVTVEALDLETKNITENGTYTPSQGKDGFSSVSVNVSSGSIPLAATYRNKISISAAEMTELLDGATTVPDFMFYLDKNLVSIDIPEGVTTIGRSTFQSCTSLVHVGLPSTLTTLGTSCFDGCSNLIDMQLPANFVYQAGFNIFRDVPAIEELKFFAGKDGTLTINNKDINGAIFAKTWRFTEGITTLSFFASNYGQLYKGYTPTEIIFPSTLTRIKTFQPNLSYTLPLLIIPDSVTTIDANALTVRDISAISLPANITSTNVPIFSPGLIQAIGFKEIYVRGNSSCSTATLLNNHTVDQLYHAKITYLGE